MKRFLVIFFIVVSSLCAGVYTFTPHTFISFGSFTLYEPHIELPEVVTAPIVKNKMLFVGDVMLARNVEKIMELYGAEYPFSNLPQLPSDTYLVGNFESAVPKTHIQTQSMQFSFSVLPKYLRGLSSYGFSYLGVANNHTYDFGHDGFINTLQALSSASTTPFGDPKNFASTTVPLIKVGNHTVALIGLYAVDVTPPQEGVATLITQASKVSDFQIVFIHWGDEYELVHNQKQEELAHQFIDAGADVIIGHHPHVVQDIEKYNGKLIFYSLGNFIFDQYFSDDVQKGLAVELSFPSGVPQLSLFPVTSLGSRSAPRYMDQYEKDIFLTELSKNSDIGLQESIVSGTLKSSF